MDSRFLRAARAVIDMTFQEVIAPARAIGLEIDHVLCRWRDQTRFGSIIGLGEGVVMINVDSGGFPPDLYRCLDQILVDGLRLVVDDEVDFEGRGHFLAKQGDRLVRMNPTQSAYALAAASLLPIEVDLSALKLVG